MFVQMGQARLEASPVTPASAVTSFAVPSQNVVALDRSRSWQLYWGIRENATTSYWHLHSASELPYSNTTVKARRLKAPSATTCHSSTSRRRTVRWTSAGFRLTSNAASWSSRVGTMTASRWCWACTSRRSGWRTTSAAASGNSSVGSLHISGCSLAYTFVVCYYLLLITRITVVTFVSKLLGRSRWNFTAM